MPTLRPHLRAGDEPGRYDFPFAGIATLNLVQPSSEAEWLFDCPNVNSSQPAILLFESIGFGQDRDQFEINGTTIAGGSRSAFERSSVGSVMLVGAGTLGSRDNFFLIVSHDERGSNLGDQDDFARDDIVILYKTLRGGVSYSGCAPPLSFGSRRRAGPATGGADASQPLSDRGGEGE